MLAVERNRPLEVVVELERRVMHLNYVILVVALDDAELTGRDGLPIPAPAEFIVFNCNMASYVGELGFEVLGVLGALDFSVEVIGVERLP